MKNTTITLKTFETSGIHFNYHYTITFIENRMTADYVTDSRDYNNNVDAIAQISMFSFNRDARFEKHIIKEYRELIENYCESTVCEIKVEYYNKKNRRVVEYLYELLDA